MEPNKKTLLTDIAKIVFSNPPNNEKSYQLICESETSEQLEVLDIFEIFLNILVEGIFIKNTINTDTIKHFNIDVILSLRPWLRSLGFDVDVLELPIQKTDMYRDYYCKVILRADPSWEQYFDMHENLNGKTYNFIFGGDSPYIRKQSCSLENLFAIFVFGSNVYKITFKCI